MSDGARILVVNADDFGRSHGVNAGVIKAHLKVSEPYYEISKVLFRIAADPKHPLSPFSKESKELRDKNVEILRRCIESQKLDKELMDKLPELLWMFKMGMILYWLHDTSAKRAKTYQFVDRTSELVATLIQFSKLPVLSGFSKKAVDGRRPPPADCPCIHSASRPE